MSTKVKEACAICGTQTMPVEETVYIEDKTYSGPRDRAVRLWFYRCVHSRVDGVSFVWLWANDAQRKHNERMYKRAF